MQANPSASEPLPRALQSGIIATLAFAGLGGSFLHTILIPLQGRLPELLDAEPSSAAWVITSTLLVSSVMTPISGKLGDMFGKRLICQLLLTLTMIGTLICAASTSLNGMILGRAFQGAGMGVIPVGISLLRDVIDRERLGSAVALVSATLGVGGALGLPISALVTEHLNWHMLFILAFGNALLAFVLTRAVLPRDQPRARGKVDFWGAIGLSILLTGLLLGLSKGNVWGWTSRETLLAFGISALTFLAWCRYELGFSNPLVDLRVSVQRAVLMTNLASVAMGFALFSSSVAFPQLLQLPAEVGGAGASLLTASLLLMPSGLAMLIMSPIAGRAQRRFGARPLLVSGAFIIAAVYALCLVLELTATKISLINMMIGIGIGLGYAAMPALIMRSVPVTQTGSANSVNTLMRSLGTTAAAAVVSAVLAGADHSDMRSAFQIVFAMGAAAAFACAVLALRIPVLKSSQS